MNRGKIILIVAICLGVCVYVCSRRMLAAPDNQPRQAPFASESGNLLPELAWLESALRLDTAQFERIKALHLAYRPRCDQLCERIRASEAALVALAAQQGSSEQALADALRTREELRLDCQGAMLAHVRETAACMSPAQSAKYLETVLPYVLGVKPTCCGGQRE